MSKYRKKKYGIYSLGRKEKKSIKKCNFEVKVSVERDKEKFGGREGGRKKEGGWNESLVLNVWKVIVVINLNLSWVVSLVVSERENYSESIGEIMSFLWVLNMFLLFNSIRGEVTGF